MATMKKALMAGALALIIAPMASTQALDDAGTKSDTSAAGANHDMPLGSGQISSYVGRRSGLQGMSKSRHTDQQALRQKDRTVKLGRPEVEKENGWASKDVGTAGAPAASADLKMGRSWHPTGADADFEKENGFVFKQVGDSGSSEVGLVDTTGTYERIAIIDVLPSAGRIDVIVRLDVQQDDDPIVAIVSVDTSELPDDDDLVADIAERTTDLLGSLLEG